MISKVTVYMWEVDWERDNIGHASIRVGPLGNPFIGNYLSVFPGENSPFIIPETGILHSYLDDVKAEGGKPTRSVEINSLNVNKVDDFIIKYKLNPLWSVTDRSCAAIVVRAILAGGDEITVANAASHGCAGIFCTPRQAISFASVESLR